MLLCFGGSSSALSISSVATEPLSLKRLRLVCLTSASLNCFNRDTKFLESLSVNRLKSPKLENHVLSQLHHSSRLDGHHQKLFEANGHFSFGNPNEIICHIDPETAVASYAGHLRRCTVDKNPQEGERVHYLMISSGYADNIFLNNLLVQMYSKCGSLQDARTVFDNMVYRNSYSWTIMLAACAQNGHSKEALRLLAQMQVEGVEANMITSICGLDACASVAALEEGREIHTSVVRNGWESNVSVGTALVTMYGKCGALSDARAVFAEITWRDVVSWNAMITACAQNGHGKDALQMFSQMQAEGFEPNKITALCVLDACASGASLKEGQEIHASIVCYGWESDVVVGTTLVNMYSKCGSLDNASAVFADMAWRTVVSWNAMIAASAQNGHSREALHLFRQMLAEGFEPTWITSVCVLDACASIAALEEGREIHTIVVSKGWESDVVVGNALVNMHGKCGSLDDARAVFAEMPDRNVVSWSAMMAVCAQNGCGKEAIQLFGQMQAEGLEPDNITFTCVLSACSHMGLVDDASQYFASMTRDHGISPSVEHYVCMIDLLGRAGQLDKAEELINSMPFECDTSAWLNLLSSCRIHGDLVRGVRAANYVFHQEENNSPPYVLLGNIHAATLGEMQEMT